VTVEIWEAAFQRLADALNHPRDPARLAGAVADDVRVDRYRPGDRATAALAETFAGTAAVARWFARTPSTSRFGLAGAPRPELNGAWLVEYAIDDGAFHNGGLWLAQLADDGRISYLAHHPFALRDPR
jgi:hypothetical protein